MSQRTNIGYTITDSITIGTTEFVIGENQTKNGTQYVTWACKNGDHYFWGHYMTDRRAAEQDLVGRAQQELSLLAALKPRQEPKGKEQER